MKRPNNGWIVSASRLPTADDADRWGMVFVWHTFQGVMLVHWTMVESNRYFSCWMQVRQGIRRKWVKASERVPTEDDGDMMHCVLAKDKHGKKSVTGWHQFGWNTSLIQWAALPGPPENWHELRKAE